MKNRFLPVLVLLLLAISVSVVSGQVFAANYTVEVDGKALVLDSAPVNVDGRILVPFRAIFEALGGTVTYDEGTKKIVGKDNNFNVELTLNSSNAIINGNSTFLDVPARLVGGRTMVPVRFVSENFGCSVDWNANAGKVSITKIQGTIQIAGSTSVQPLSEELAKSFMAKYPKVKVNIAGGGSGAGITAAQKGTTDIGASSRELTEAEKPTVKEQIIALDGIAIIVNNNNTVSDLTKEQIKKIFSGEIKKWSEVGGTSDPIRVVGREEGSGTRGAFEELVLGKGVKMTSSAIIQNSTGAVRTAVGTDSSAIGYISLGSLDNSVKGLKVGGVTATVVNVKNNSYPIWRPFLYMTQFEPVGTVKVFIDWVKGPSGQAIVSSHKYITID